MAGSTRTSRRKLVYIGVGLLALVVLSSVAPFVIWALILFGMPFVPEGSDAVYDGMRARVHGNEVIEIYLGSASRAHDDRFMYSNRENGRPIGVPNSFFVRVNGKAKELKDAQPADLETEGFERGYTSSYTKGRPSPVYSFATFTQGKLQSLILAPGEEAELSFASSAGGPFLTLPVSLSEFQRQFGKPKRWERRYRDRHALP